jgi:predicted HTH transcriptional regulator
VRNLFLVFLLITITVKISSIQENRLSLWKKEMTRADEKQDVEYKSSWRDEYLKWICGYANAFGGRLYIGVNDNKEVIGVDNIKKLSEDIPNKIQNILGIISDVNILTDSTTGKHYLEIVTESYPYPVSYKGEYHYRSGSVKQELKGAALNKFISKSVKSKQANSDTFIKSSSTMVGEAKHGKARNELLSQMAINRLTKRFEVVV